MVSGIQYSFRIVIAGLSRILMDGATDPVGLQMSEGKRSPNQIGGHEIRRKAP